MGKKANKKVGTLSGLKKTKIHAGMFGPLRNLQKKLTNTTDSGEFQNINENVQIECDKENKSLPHNPNPKQSSLFEEIEHTDFQNHSLVIDWVKGNTPPQQNLNKKRRPYFEETEELDFENHSLVIETAPSTEEDFNISGRRIVDVMFLIDQLKNIFEHGTKLGCRNENLKVVAERRCGLSSKITLRCNFCNDIFPIMTNQNNMDRVQPDINNSAVAGIMAIGGGFSALQEFLGALDIPAMSQATYQKLHENVSKQWEDTSIDVMTDAAAEERDAAIEEGRLDRNGVPMIDVIADGCWGKRSYRCNYSSLSGAAAIVGRKTGKVLFMAVRNKFCSICSFAERKKKPVSDHVCYKNYSGSSSGMEAEIILEGFKRSISMYNLLFARIISDGDSSTYSKILAARPYTDYTVEKVECRNHVLRNYCNKLRALTLDTKFPKKFRNLITAERIMSLRTAVTSAIKHNKNQTIPLSEKINNLFSDIINSTSHVFGDHTKCKTYFCTGPKPNEKNIVLELKSNPIWVRLCLINNSVASHSRSLVYDVDSNVVERYNSIVAKFIGGKRINYSCRQSYQARCHAAVVSFNTRRPIYTLQKKMLGRSPKSNVISKIEGKRYKKTQYNLNFVRKKNRSRHFDSKKGNKEYGDASEQVDMEPDLLEKGKKLVLSLLVEKQQVRNQIQELTVLQGDSNEWREHRRMMLTASNFGRVIKKKDSTGCGPLVRSLIIENNLSHVASISHGMRNEKLALTELSIQENIQIKPCGLFIDSKIPFLGATPDGITDDMVVEVKCPITAFKLGLEEAIKRKKVTFWKRDGSVNRSHLWYYQIQGQLRVTGKSICLFGLWSGSNMPLKVEYIKKDDLFWKDQMEVKLVRFYMECVLPEIVDSRSKRNMPIRESDHIIQAQERRTLKRRLIKRKLDFASTTLTSAVASTADVASTSAAASNSAVASISAIASTSAVAST